MNKLLNPVASILFAVLSTGSVAHAVTQKVAEKGVVVLIQMIPEFWTDDAASHFESGFHQAGSHPDIYIIDANSDSRNGIKYDGKLTADTHPNQRMVQDQRDAKRLARVREGIQKIVTQLKSERKRITHISIAGHGAVEGTNFLLGEFKFDARIDEVKKLLAPLSPYLADEVKILLTSCSIFEGKKSDAQTRAVLLSQALGAKSAEIFAYTQIASTQSIYDFYSTNRFATGVVATFATLLPSLVIFSKAQGAFAFTAFVSSLVNGYNYFAYDWYPFKQMRQRRNAGDMGYVVTVEKGTTTSIKKGLGNDYFNKYFVTPNSQFPF